MKQAMKTMMCVALAISVFLCLCACGAKNDTPAATDPVIKHTRFTATGTRFLEANGRRAIVELYARSFNR